MAVAQQKDSPLDHTEDLSDAAILAKTKAKGRNNQEEVAVVIEQCCPVALTKLCDEMEDNVASTKACLPNDEAIEDEGLKAQVQALKIELNQWREVVLLFLEKARSATCKFQDVANQQATFVGKARTELALSARGDAWDYTRVEGDLNAMLDKLQKHKTALDVDKGEVNQLLQAADGKQTVALQDVLAGAEEHDKKVLNKLREEDATLVTAETEIEDLRAQKKVMDVTIKRTQAEMDHLNGNKERLDKKAEALERNLETLSSEFVHGAKIGAFLKTVQEQKNMLLQADDDEAKTHLRSELNKALMSQLRTSAELARANPSGVLNPMMHFVFIADHTQEIVEFAQTCASRRNASQRASDRVSLVRYGREARCVRFNGTWADMASADQPTEADSGCSKLTAAWKVVSSEVIQHMQSNVAGQPVRTVLICITNSASGDDSHDEMHAAAAECYSQASSGQNSCVGMVFHSATMESSCEVGTPININGMVSAMNGGGCTITDSAGQVIRLSEQLADKPQLTALVDAIGHRANPKLQQLKSQFEELDAMNQKLDDKERDDLCRMEEFLTRAQVTCEKLSLDESCEAQMQELAKACRLHLEATRESVKASIDEAEDSLKTCEDEKMRVEAQLKALDLKILDRENDLTRQQQMRDQAWAVQKAAATKKKLDEKFCFFNLPDVNAKLEKFKKHQQRGRILMRHYQDSVGMAGDLMTNSITQLKQEQSPNNDDGTAPMRVLDHYFRTKGLGVKISVDVKKADVKEIDVKEIDVKETSCDHASWTALVKHIWPEREAEEVETFASMMHLEEYIYQESELAADNKSKAEKVVELRELLETRLIKDKDELAEWRDAFDDASADASSSRREVKGFEDQIKEKKAEVATLKQDKARSADCEDMKKDVESLQAELARATTEWKQFKEVETKAKRELHKQLNSRYKPVISMSDRMAKDIRDAYTMVRLGAGAERFRAALTGTNSFFAKSITGYCRSSSQVLASYSAQSSQKPQSSVQITDVTDDLSTADPTERNSNGSGASVQLD